MKTQLALPDLLLIGMTRGMLGAGIGLLLAGRLDGPPRRALGWGLLAVGVLTTLPLALQVLAGMAPTPAPPARRARRKRAPD
jgi:hypothetical protein